MSTDVVKIAEERRDAIKLMIQHLISDRDMLLDMVTVAQHDEDHLALGYPSWTAYVSTEFSGLLTQLTREDKREMALTLTETGMSTRAIAPLVGLSHQTVMRDTAGGPDGPPAEPSDITGLDGKTYAKPERKPLRRNPLPKQFWDATYDLSKVTRRLEKLHADDRFASNSDALRTHKVDLFRAQTIIRKIIEDLP